MRPIVVKYGGNAMKNHSIQSKIVSSLSSLSENGFPIVLVHGGGPFIDEQLRLAGIESEFVDGHRVTTPEALLHIEMALKGRVNSTLVRLFNENGKKAVGLSGKDGQMVMAKQRLASHADSAGEPVWGCVGDVTSVDPTFLKQMLDEGAIPVVACLATDEEGRDYNVNGDLMAGHIAAALQTEHLVVLTDVDGLRANVNDPNTLIDELFVADAKKLIGKSVVGGMIPKMESCIVALEGGAEKATIMNGMKPELLFALINEKRQVGTTIIRDES